MVVQGLDKKTDAVDNGRDTPAGDPEAGEQDADAIPIELQLQGDGPNLGRFHDLLLGSAKMPDWVVIFGSACVNL
jgi:hypothetical protein